jgi:UDP-N-acetylmuramoylalanine--D-glutamate ligase
MVSDWRGRRVVVLGLARQGKALARFLAEGGAHVVVSDIKAPDALAGQREELGDLPIEFALGGHPPELIEDADLVCLSGGVPADLPLATQARERGIPLSNDSQVFLEACPAATIGITGSAGKTTTTALVGRMAEAELAGSGRHAWVGGNIGRPLLADLPAMGRDDWVVLELSSFQLELMNVSPRVAAVLNLTPNHLDRHHTMEAYTAAKVRILTFQKPEEVAVLGRDDAGAWALRSYVRGRLLSFGWEAPSEGEGTFLSNDQIWLRLEGREAPICPIGAVELRGMHTLLNVAAACAIAAGAGFSPRAMGAGIRGFTGVPHRLEFVRRVNGVDWYNDSIATAPERSMAAIRAFDEPLVLLAGGRDKDLPWEAFGDLVCRRVDHLVLFGEAAGKILRAVEAARTGDRPFTLDGCPGLEAAVATAARVAEPGDVVLLAPGGTSFDEFADFVERGERFRALVEAL